MNDMKSPDDPPPEPVYRSRRLGEVLRDSGLLSDAQIQAALAEQERTSPRRPLGEVLVAMKLVTANQVARALAESVGVPFVLLTPDQVNPEALHCLPASFIEEHTLLPLSTEDGWLTVAVERFCDTYLIEDIRRCSALQVMIVAAEGVNIRQTRLAVQGNGGPPLLERGREVTAELDKVLGHLPIEEFKVLEFERREDRADLDTVVATDSPIIKLVNCIIQYAVETSASDVHIEPDDDCFRVRCRIDGDLIETVRPSARLLPAVVSRIKILAGMDISERRLPQDGGISVRMGDRPIDLRVSTMATKYGEKVVMRIVDRNARVLDLDVLGFEPDMLSRFRAVTRESNGILIVTGPTGSGKTSTLYAALSEIVSVKRNICTIEDPIERRLPGTNQFQVNNGAGFTFANALRSLLRQDPDIIMVGEVRDPETAKLAMEAALTGHMVLTTLHTNDAPTAVPRLVNMGVPPYLVAAALRGVLAQRLVRRVCPDCRKPVKLSSSTMEALAQVCRGPCPVDTEYVGAGCSRCRLTGFAGRIGVFELLLLNEELLSLIARDPSVRGVQELARRQRWHSLLEDGLQKVKRGLIRVDSLMEIVSRTDTLIDELADPNDGPDSTYSDKAA
jgi:type IV pilus assembly protein PilB